MTDIQRIDYHAEIMRGLLWQHNRAANLEALISGKDGWFKANHGGFWDDWLRDVFDLRTANEFGLQVWARILNVPLQVNIPPTAQTSPAFGFGAFNANFNNGGFSNSGGGIAGLSVDQQRLLLRLRYCQLVSRCTVTDINRILANVFKDQGTVYVVDPLDMSFIVYVFDFAPGSQLMFLLEQFDLMPRPATVGVKYLVSAIPNWGFGEYHINFNNGNFHAG